MGSAIEFVNVSSGYHDHPVISDLSLAIQEGEMAGLIGPNAAGKTTLMRTATGLCPPLNGMIQLFGKDLFLLPAETRARLVAVVPQEVQTPIAFTVEQVVMVGRTASLSRWARPSAYDRSVIDRSMVYTDVADMRHRPLNELSAGEKQRVIVAMALAQEPRIILMDEATSHLDINHRLEIMQIVERLNSERLVTVMMISHDLNLAAEFCSRLLLMDHGRIVADGSPSEVLTERNLQKVYHCDIRVQQNVSGSVSVVPAPRLSERTAGKGKRIHVIGGGGCAGEILRRLSLCNYQVTCGVLNEGDSDADVTAAMSIESALEKPFSPVGPSALARALDMVRQADAVIVTSVPFGIGNLANMELAEHALANGKRVFIMDNMDSRDYTPQKDAAAKTRDLAGKGASLWQDITGLFDMLGTL